MLPLTAGASRSSAASNSFAETRSSVGWTVTPSMRAIAARMAASPRARMSASRSAAILSASGSNVGRIMNSSTVVERRAGFQWTTRKWEGVEGLME